jgi:S-methylmethionine-dependent homocysteine/selenocysteine methylase
MSLSNVTIAYLGSRLKLVKERAPNDPIYSLRAFINERWVILNSWNDIGHAASLLVLFGYQADMQSALNMLNVLNVT